MKPPPQYEDPDAAASIALFKARTPQANAEGAFVSGARILNFQKGWAIPVLIVRASSSHWFRRLGSDWAEALCGVQAPLELIHGAGNYPRCGNCIKTMSRLIRQGAM